MEQDAEKQPTGDSFSEKGGRCCPIPCLWWFLGLALLLCLIAYVMIRTAPRYTSNVDVVEGVDVAELLEGNPDYDGDGIPDLMDNCVQVANRDQQDTDHSGTGDVCEVIVFAKEDLDERLGGVPGNLLPGSRVMEVEGVVWPDGCLGVPAHEVCVPGEVPGYRVVLENANVRYVYHTDLISSFRYVGIDTTAHPMVQ